MTDSAGDTDRPPDDRLARVAAQLKELEQAPLDARPAMFEAINRELVEELSAMDAD